MPNPQNLIDDLSYLIQESKYEIEPDNVESIKSEVISEQSLFTTDSDVFGYAIPMKEGITKNE